ncbi:MAG: hypothetical protein ACI4DS_03050 [Eubacterium sp.]
MQSKQFLILGEEARQLYLADILKESGHIVKAATDYIEGDYDAVMLPVSESKKYLEKVNEELKEGQIVFGCNFPAAITKRMYDKVFFVDYMKLEGIAFKNAVATAEGAIAEAIVSGSGNLHGSNSLLTGYGRCGEILAEKLGSMKSHVTVMERKEEKRAKAQAYGFETADFNDEKIDYIKYDFIFNTIPSLIITDKIIDKLKTDVCIIDIASKPGGVDFDYCRKKGINAKLCLGLPGKYSPKTSAKIMAEAINRTLLMDK